MERRLRTFRTALGLACVVCAVAGATGNLGATAAALRCDVRRVDTANRNGLDPKLAFELASNSDGVRIYQSWNSWGYYARYFLAYVHGEDQTTYVVQKRPGEWTKNWPQIDVLNRGQSVIEVVDLCDGTWFAAPNLRDPSHAPLALVPQFRMESDSNVASLLSRMEYNPLAVPVWSGQIAGTPVDVALSQQCVERLDAEHP